MNNYFEGYYFKLTNNQETLCFIVGYTLGENSHSFIQVFGSNLAKMYYFRYETLMCTMMRKPLYIRINNNIFTKNKVQIDLENDEIIIKGFATFTDQVGLLKSWYTPTIMGPLTYVPCHCIHELVNVYSRVSGSFQIRGQSMVFENAFGYVEGDRGSSFPTSYIWLQAIEEEFSIFLSIALVDTEFGSFKGGIACIHTKNVQYRLTSYYLAKFSILKDVDTVWIQITQGALVLLLKVTNYDTSTELAAPEQGVMCGKTNECVDARVSVFLFKHGVCVVSRENLLASVELKTIEDLL